MKRLITAGIAVVMCLSVASCKDKERQLPEYKYPTSVTDTIYDCEYTVSIDKNSYTYADAIEVTVTLENKGDTPVGLSAGMLDTVVFYENGIQRPHFLNEDYVPAPDTSALSTGIAGSASDATDITAAVSAETTAAVSATQGGTDAPEASVPVDEVPRILEPGETVSVTKYFTPGDPPGAGIAALMDSDWRIRAKVEVCSYIPEGFPETDGEYEAKIIGITVPH